MTVISFYAFGARVIWSLSLPVNWSRVRNGYWSVKVTNVTLNSRSMRSPSGPIQFEPDKNVNATVWVTMCCTAQRASTSWNVRRSRYWTELFILKASLKDRTPLVEIKLLAKDSCFSISPRCKSWHTAAQPELVMSLCADGDKQDWEVIQRSQFRQCSVGKFQRSNRKVRTQAMMTYPDQCNANVCILRSLGTAFCKVGIPNDNSVQ